MALSTVTAHHDRLGRLDIPVLIGQVIENNLHIAVNRGLAIDCAYAFLGFRLSRFSRLNSRLDTIRKRLKVRLKVVNVGFLMAVFRRRECFGLPED